MSLLLFLPPPYQNHGVYHLLPSGIVWATVHYALTPCPRRPPAHLFIPQGFFFFALPHLTLFFLDVFALC